MAIKSIAQSDDPRNIAHLKPTQDPAQSAAVTKSVAQPDEE